MSIKPSVAILSRSAKTRDELTRDLDYLRADFPDINIVGLEMSQMGEIGEATQLVLLDLEIWIPSDELALSDLRSTRYEGPVIILTKRVDEAMSASYEAEKVVFVDRSKNPRQLRGIVKRIVLGAMIAARKHPRHDTNETAEMTLEATKTVYNCRVRNMSKGGAFLELDRAIQIRIGDMVRVKFVLGQLNRTYSVRARIAWTHQRGIGVQFLAES